jgi:hypothetical protein
LEAFETNRWSTVAGKALNRTQASSVRPVVSSKLAELLIVTQLLVPLNDSAFPNRPAVFQVAPVMVAVLPLPDMSFTVVPVPSSKP